MTISDQSGQIESQDFQSPKRASGGRFKISNVTEKFKDAGQKYAKKKSQIQAGIAAESEATYNSLSYLNP